MSAFGGKADMTRIECDVRFWPEAYAALHATIVSGRVRVAMDGGAKIARYASLPVSRSRLISRYPTTASSHRRRPGGVR